MFKWKSSLMIVLVLVALLAACGQKGPLYLPDEQVDTAQTGTAAGDVDQD